jgi:hypothetical protein
MEASPISEAEIAKKTEGWEKRMLRERSRLMERVTKEWKMYEVERL